MTRIATSANADGFAGRTASDDDVIAQVSRWITEGDSWCSDVHDRTEDNNEYVAGGTQWKPGDIQKQDAKGRPHFVLNKLLHVVNAIANREITERYVPKVYGRSREDQPIAESYDEFLRWQRDRADAAAEESAAFRAMVMSGYSCLHKYWDPLEENGEGLITEEEVPIWEMLWDSRASKANLADRRWHIAGRWVSRKEAELEFSDLSVGSRRLFSRLAGAKDSEETTKSHGGKTWASVVAGNWYSRADDELFIVEAEWRDVIQERKAAIPVRFDELVMLATDPNTKVVLAEQDPFGTIDPVTGQPVPWVITGAEYQSLDEEDAQLVQDILLEETKLKVMTPAEIKDFSDAYLDIVGTEFVDHIKFKRYDTRYALVCDGEVLETGKRPMGFTYEFMTGFPKHMRDGTTFFGFVDVAKGMQDWRNTFMNLVLTRLATSPKQQIVVEETAIEDSDYFFDQLSNPRGGAVVPDGFIAGKRWMTLDSTSMPPLERELIAFADAGIAELAGLSSLEMNQQQDLRRVSGKVADSVKGSSTTILAILFDSLRRARRRSGVSTLKFMHQFYTVDQVARIIGPEKSMPLAEYDTFPELERFDLRLDEAPVSVNERMEFFNAMVASGELSKWLDAGYIPFDIVLDWHPMVTESDKQRIRQYREQQQNTAQIAAMLLAAGQQLQGTPLGDQITQMAPSLQQVRPPSG